MFQATFVARVERCSIPCDLSHATKIAANTYDTLRDLSHVTCCMQQNQIVYTHLYYSLFTFSWPRFESGSLRNNGMLILRIYLAVDGMPIEMYGES